MLGCCDAEFIIYTKVKNMNDNANEEKPNIFKFGTSESTQDAFICWLLEWAKPDLKSSNLKLHQTAQKMIKEFFKKAGKKLEEDITSIEPVKTSRVDIERIINGKYHLIIEDKTKTKNHSKQLERYLEKAKKKHGKGNVIAIYLKTYDQDDYQEITKAKFHPFLRTDFLGILKNGKNTTSEIFKDFYYHLLDLDNEVESYANTKIDDWKPRAWEGFYKTLKERLGKANWKNIPRKTGGFLCFTCGRTNDYDKFRYYLQLESNGAEPIRSINIKIAAPDNDSKTRSRLRKQHYKFMKQYFKKLNFNFDKPKKFGNGEHMTILQSTDDARKTDSKGIIDIDATVAYIKKIVNAIKKYSET
jgi:hypothetical protein